MTDRPRPPSLADLAAAERDAAPDPAAEARVWAAVEHRLTHGPPPPALPDPGAGALLKWIGGLALVGGLVGGALAWPRDAPPEPPVSPPPVGRPAALGPDPEDMSPAPWPIVQVAPPAPPAPRPRPTTPPPRKPPAPAPAAPAEPHDLAAELRLIAEIRADLRRGDPAATLAGVREHRATFGRDGALIEERSAHEVEALCAVGQRGESRRLAAEFLRRWPQSPQRASVAASCAD